MSSNYILHILLESWFYNDIIKIILSYRTLDYEKLLVSTSERINCYDIIVIDDKIYIEYDCYYYNDTLNYFDLSSKKMFKTSDNNLTEIFDKYKTSNKISNNLLLGHTLRLYYDLNKFFELYADKFEIYKNYLFYKESNCIYYADSDLADFRGILFYDPKKETNHDIDFDIFDDYIYVYDGDLKILMYNILDKKLELESEKIFDETSNSILDNYYFNYNDNCYTKIYVTKNYVFLYLVSCILIFFRDLKFFRKINLPSNVANTYCNGFFVQNNIIYLVNDDRIEIYQLYQ